MVFLIKKKIKGKNYYSLAEYNKNKKDKVRIIKYLGSAEKIKEIVEFYEKSKNKD